MEKYSYIRKTITWDHRRYEVRAKPSRRPVLPWKMKAWKWAK